ncbi:XkdX family protein [Staphylococcus pettenkoferi]|uniref:XkdX family protein n=1 Tax=Staphylococcus pettenkoferi TaxID=170573 RepID=UPI00164238FF|nr:XkdX family protein [Staphylococcus pettenkoferi]
MYPGFDSIKYFYDINCYTNEDIQTYVELDALTKEEYKKSLEKIIRNNHRLRLVVFYLDGSR